MTNKKEENETQEEDALLNWPVKIWILSHRDTNYTGTVTAVTKDYIIIQNEEHQNQKWVKKDKIIDIEIQLTEEGGSQYAARNEDVQKNTQHQSRPVRNCP